MKLQQLFNLRLLIFPYQGNSMCKFDFVLKFVKGCLTTNCKPIITGIGCEQDILAVLVLTFNLLWKMHLKCPVITLP